MALPTSFDWDPNFSIVFGVLDCHSMSSGGGCGGVYNHASSQSNAICALRGTRPDASKTLRQFPSVNTSKKRVFKGGEEAFLIDVEVSLVC
jgi:hypothetical protein